MDARRRGTTWLALSLWLLVLALTAASGVMKALGWHGAGNTSTTALVALFAAFIAFATVGAIVAARVPGNPLGWIFVTVAFLAVLSGAAENYAFHGLVDAPGSLPAALFVGWIYAWGWYPTVGLIMQVPLLYPTGKVPGPRWRIVQRALVGLLTLVTLRYMFYPGPLDGSSSARTLPDNPVGIGFVGGPLDEVDSVVGVIVLALLGAALLSVIVRFRHSRGDERQQMKWMTVAVTFIAVAATVPQLVGLSFGQDILFAVGIAQFPIVVGIAILRYRLYEIDRLISRTISYAILTGLLVGAFIGVVVLTTDVLPFSSPVGVAASTLCAAALFNPLRKRVQRLVDRRFNRARYDAEAIVAAFTLGLRDAVDLDTVRGELLLAVGRAVEPTHASVWIRPPTRVEPGRVSRRAVAGR